MGKIDEAKQRLDNIVDSCRSLNYVGFMEVVEDANFILELLNEKVAKPILIREGKSKMYNDYRCSRCDQEVVYEQNYCCECGSLIDWATD